MELYVSLAAHPPAQPPTILVVEDEVVIRMATADFLRDCGFRVIEAATAAEALEVLATRTPINVLFTDVMLPYVSGLELAQRVRRDRPEIRVLLTSGMSEQARAAAELCEQGGILPKPYDFDDIERRIRNLLKDRRHDAGPDLPARAAHMSIEASAS